MENFDSQLTEVEKLEGHTGRIWYLAWKPVNGGPDVLASCSGDKTVRIWEQIPATGSFQCKAVLKDTHTSTVRSCAWSPCGRLLVTASLDATFAIWAHIFGVFTCLLTRKFIYAVRSVSWSASGSFLAVGVDKSIIIWYVFPRVVCQQISVFRGHTAHLKLLQWHPSVNTLLFSSSFDSSIKVWADEGRNEWLCIQTLNESLSGHTSTVWALSFNVGGDKMVSCSEDNTIKIWSCGIVNMQYKDRKTPWSHVCTLSGYHDRTIYSIHWSGEGVIYSGAGGKAICCFVENKDDSVDGLPYKLVDKKEMAHEVDVNVVQCSSKVNRRLASGGDDGTVKIWEFVSTCGKEKMAAASSGKRKMESISTSSSKKTMVIFND